MTTGRSRLCPRCGDLVGSEDDQCYSCGLRLGSPAHGLVSIQGSLRGLLRTYGSATGVLMGFILVVYAGMVILNGGFMSRESTGLMGGFSLNTLLRCGAAFPNYVEHGQSWRLVTAMFLHGGPLHVAFNLYVLYQLGRLSELYFDARRTFVIFFVSGFLGFVGSMLYGNFSVGASGAIMGLAGAILARARYGGGGFDRAVLGGLGRWVVLIVILGFIVPRIDWVGHLVGLLTGGGVGYLLIREGGLRPRVHTALFVAAVVVTVVCIGLGLSFCINHPPPYYLM